MEAAFGAVVALLGDCLVATGMTTNRYSRGARALPVQEGARGKVETLKRCKAHAVARKLFTRGQMPLLLGAHTIDNGGIDMAALRAGNGGMTALQIFTTIPKYYGDKASIRPERVERFKAALKKAGIKPENVVVHSAYVLEHGFERRGEVGTRARWAGEGARALECARGWPALFPSGRGDGRRSCVGGEARGEGDHARAQDRRERDARAHREHGGGGAHDGAHARRDRDDARGRAEVAARAHGLRARHVPFLRGRPRHQRVEVGADEDPRRIRRGGGRAAVVLSSQRQRGRARLEKDRHMLIGEGKIGKDAFGWLLADKRAKKVPLILETPQANFEIADDDATPDPYDVKMMKLLRGMEK